MPTRTLTTLSAALVAAIIAFNAEAAPKTKASGPTGPKTKPLTAKATKPAAGPKKSTSTPKKPTTAPRKSTTAPKKSAASTTTKTKGAERKAAKVSSGTAETTTTTTTPSPAPAKWEPTNPVAAKLSDKPNQLARARAVLPKGTDINDATAGFKNFGQFNAAVNASQNLGITFDDLKAAMTGTRLDGSSTGEATLSLGQAIKQFKPGVDADAEAALATSQAAAAGQ